MTKYTGIKESHCNRCGRYHQTNYDKMDETPFDEENFLGRNFFHDFHAYFGYGSPYDSEVMRFSLCEICLFEIVKDFKHAPTLREQSSVVLEESEDEPAYFDYETFESIRHKKDPHFDDFFMYWYQFVTNLPRK